MTAGIEWNEAILPYDDGRNDFERYNSSADPIAYLLGKALIDTPGSQWTYNSALTDLVGAVIENLTGQPLIDYADRVLFGPLGITEYEWLRSKTWPADSFPSAGAGLRMRARDLAKIASLVLHSGKWQGQQIVPVEWITTSTARHVQNPWSQPGPFGYGYFWYPGTINDARTPIHGSLVIYGSGSGNQAIFVLPDAELTITVLAGNYKKNSLAADIRILGIVTRGLR